MKTLFLEARSDQNISLPKKLIDIMPEKIGLFTTVQHLDQISSIKKQLRPKQVLCSKGKRCKNECQVLGCDADAALDLRGKVDAFLYIGSGMFHPKFLAIRLADKGIDTPIFTFDPLTKESMPLDRKSIERIIRRRKGALLKFHTSENIGILVSTKPGQEKLRQAFAFKERIRPKKGYILVSDTLDFAELENFPFIECFVNTMCERIGYDDTIRSPRPIINIEDIR